MISTAKVWERVNLLLKSGTSGYQTAAEFNSDMYSTLLRIITVLCDNYETNEKVSDLITKDGLLVEVALATNSSGFITFPNNHFRTATLLAVDGSGNEFETTKIRSNEKGGYLRSSIRKVSYPSGVKYYFANSGLNTLPKQVTPIKLIYCIKPAMPNLVLTVDPSDYQVVDNSTTNIPLAENLFNLFVYEMVERVSVEMKEQTTMAYAELGISRETVR